MYKTVFSILTRKLNLATLYLIVIVTSRSTDYFVVKYKNMRKNTK